VRERPIGIQGVEFFLCLHGSEGVKNEFSSAVIADSVSIVVFGDIGNEFAEEGYFEYLIGGDEFQTCERVVTGLRWGRWAIWETSVCLNFDPSELIAWVCNIWETVPERVVVE
jgi:hypothetical protein